MTTDDDRPAGRTLETEAFDWVVRFVAGGAGPAELRALETWAARSPAHAAAFDHASRTWKALDPARRTAALRAAAPKPVIEARPALWGRRAVLGGALAASAAGAAVLALRPPLGLWPSLSEFAADYRTDTGERRQVTLAGHVSVELNTQTSIALRASGERAEQFELISGEAFVTTPPEGRAVTVMVADGRVVAERARFNLRYDRAAACVTCLAGTINVERGAAAVELAAGQQVSFMPDGLARPEAIDAVAVAAWTGGVVIFDAMPVSQVVVEVNRYRRGRIVLTNAALGRERFSARFRIENIDRVVGQIAQVFGAHTRTLPGGVTLLG